MRPRSSILLIAICLFAVAACDQGTTVSVKNDSDRTFVAQVGADALLIVPPKQHLTVAVIGFKATVPEIQLLGADCAPVGKPRHDGGTFTISAQGTVSFSNEISGPPEVNAEESSFCAGAIPGPSPVPSPVPSDPGPS